MNCRASTSSLVAGALLALAPTPSAAEAWTLEKDRQLFILGALYGAANERIGGGAADFSKTEFGYYTEYGWTDRFTGVLRAPVRLADDGENRGWGGEGELYGRYRVLKTGRWSAVGSLGVGYGVADFEGRDIARVYDGYAGEARGAVGYGAEKWFAEIAGGRRLIEGRGGDEWRADGALGWKPNVRTEVFLKSASTWRARAGARPADEFHKLQLSATRRFGAVRVELGGGATVLGDGAPRERFVLLNFWRSV